MQSTVSTSFTLTNFECDPNDISLILDIKPTKTWKTGDYIGKSAIRYRHNGWSINTQLPHSQDLEEQIANLLEVLSPVWNKLIELGNLYDLELACVIYSYETQGPGIHLSKQILQKIVEVNAEFDVDYYCMATTEE
jgi:Domain of unknown function (DUF4279)